MQRRVFDSRDGFYRSPCGAVACGQALRLRLCLKNTDRVDQAFICLYEEVMQQNSRKRMRLVASEDGYDVFEAT